MKTKEVQVLREQGMDAMSVALCVQRASQFRASVYLTDGSRRMNAKSLMGMMTLGLVSGDSITVEADGADEDDALSGLCAFFEGN
ncbi:MAG: HPr family phosphocarrier protein [Lachnospiraceae bacterium]|nr:HPr family phosphocarrier protein [Lachnospiraceae bacterium]